MALALTPIADLHSDPLMKNRFYMVAYLYGVGDGAGGAVTGELNTALYGLSPKDHVWFEQCHFQTTDVTSDAVSAHINGAAWSCLKAPADTQNPFVIYTDAFAASRLSDGFYGQSMRSCIPYPMPYYLGQRRDTTTMDLKFYCTNNFNGAVYRFIARYLVLRPT